jgi:hypothetical protein
VKEGIIFNWAQILNDNILCNVNEVSIKKIPGFYILNYFIDSLFSSISFVGMNLTWNHDLPPIHIYCFVLWKCNYKKYFYGLCDEFMVPLFDPGGYRWPPTYSTGSKTNFHFGSFFLVFQVLNFRDRFEAPNNIFWACHNHMVGFNQIVMTTCVVLG